MKRYKNETGEEVTQVTPEQGQEQVEELQQAEEEQLEALQQAEEEPAENDVSEVVDKEVSSEKHAVSEEIVPSEEAEYQEEPLDQPRRLTWPTREQWIGWLPFLAVVLFGAILRFWGLGDKPLHHDESLHAYFSLQLMHNMENWIGCFAPGASCYHYDPLLHGPFQFHAIAFVYKISQILGAPDHGVNTTTVRIAAATLGSLLVGLPYFLRDYLGRIGAWLACFLLAISPSMVYFSRFAREDIYMAFFTLWLVVSVARYIRDRQMKWLIMAAVAFALSYATKEATFLTVAVFGSFFAAVAVWELGLRWPLREKVTSDAAFVQYLPRTFAPVALLGLLIVGGLCAKVFFAWLHDTSIYITKDAANTAQADAYVANLKSVTVAIVPWIGILLGAFVLFVLVREMMGKLPPPGRHGLSLRVDPERQPLLDAVVTMQWTHWFFALLCGWAVFLVLFTVLFTNIRGGIGDGIWQGLYYWLQQQQVARGGQPWYYYLLLIPLYEQIGLVFGLVGVVRCLLRPTRFRLFLVYWFVGNVFIYSWAAEKMPWLMIHLTMPMMVLAAIGLEPVVVPLLQWSKGWLKRAPVTDIALQTAAYPVPPHVKSAAGVTAIVSGVLAVLLLIPTLQNMYQVTYVHYADAPHEMMIYVQTTTDVNAVMAKVDELDQKLYGGRHELPIGLTDDATWPYAWYLRDYTHVCFQFPNGCADTAKSIPIIITGGDTLASFQSQYSAGYAFHQYHMRTWWDEGYKPPPVPPNWGGVGPWIWLSYGDTPPQGASFDLGKAVSNVWQWWWYRKAIGSTQGSYDMGLFIRKDLGVTP
ncbi:hypothetical protein KSF_017860 [Reticulibacter mediterranei]|uniref:ArnT-like N-terminal domain-containing protein n=1 Tax=Reticulibacter mediterranei TaxID=2778369 RepID=A0A8J3IFU2_9CHLR|nr:flippase activity-associated protein Agl23 [Reticulibacter mediterranei]GHO91738.1 hypothetical protein KSF_017860 [Reticulibacter mediterranei]